LVQLYERDHAPVVPTNSSAHLRTESGGSADPCFSLRRFRYWLAGPGKCGQSHGGISKLLRKGSRYRLVFVNRTGDAHPLHRNTFELSQVNGKSTSGVRKDVMLLKPYQTAAVDFAPRQEGLVLFHFHQQMHMDQGFRTLFRVV
jgi:hypothetical protein